MVATSYMCQVNIWNVFREVEEKEKEFEELNFKFYLILIDLSLNLDSHTWLTVT